MGIIMVPVSWSIEALENFNIMCFIVPILVAEQKSLSELVPKGGKGHVGINKNFCAPARKYSNSNKPTRSITGAGLDNLSYYLAGLIEGDGHFNIPKSLKGLNGKARVAGIEIVFALKDRPSAELLRDIFGGNLYEHPKRNMVRWMIQDLKSVANIINSINGKLRTPKINGLHDMIDFINSNPAQLQFGDGGKIVKLPLDTSPLESNAWLSGFIDADGCFMLKGFTSNLRTYLAIQFYLPQRANDRSGESMEIVMEKIAKFLLFKLKRRTVSEKYNQFVINTSNSESNRILIQYLNTFPLLSSKYLDYKDWEKAYYIYTSKLHKDPVYYEQVKVLKLNMNKNRTSFSWSHHKSATYGLDSK
jgi:hypothetical protein